MDHSNEINKYATMYDQLKALYGPDLDTMINVIYLSRNNEDRTVAYERVESEYNERVVERLNRLSRVSGLLGALSIPGWFYLFVQSIRRLI